ncbi:1,2-phenylacetyl-CoA epoxidase subunit PaaE [uncultured Piscinibacter sp.]|uniref:1,2-phenylacetyl-CoA epoxidase subunit PaaE n=1 Tax=uncultured Piscinibacter sp. TaxID=1131835 RepID=UPI0026363963|nr:1,2-phenylacetyl-CoA epoxidase subunit PaaE [uncultured Piscinibacter sp.]
MSLQFHSLPVQNVQQDADALIVGFGVPPALRDTFAFAPGQYLTLRAEVAGEDLRRSYSICSGLDDGALRVGIRLLPGGAFSGWAAENLREGQTMQVMPPQGRFTLTPDPASQRHLLFIAAGSGITPMLSLIKSLLGREPATRCTLVYGNRRVATMMFKEELEDLKDRYLQRFTLLPVFSREAQDAPLFNGRLDEARIAEFLRTLVPADTVDEAFVCGPAGVLDGAVAALAGAGLAVERIHVERFGDVNAAAAHHVEAGDADHAKVTLVIDGLARQVEFRLSDPSILDAARRTGLDVPYACKAGVCSTCKGKLLDGQVRMDRNFALTEAEVAQGFVLCCQAHPTTPGVTITLDER